MIRVARIITRLNIGGPAIQAVSLSARLEQTGYHTLLIHGRLGAGEGDMRYLVPRDHAFEIANVPALRREVAPAADAAALATVARLLRRFKPSIVHTHMAKAGTIGRVAAIMHNALSGRRARARIVHTYHGHVLDGYFDNRTARAFSTAERVLASRSDALVAVSPSVRDDLIQTHHIGDPARFHIVPLGFDLGPFTAIGPVERAAARRALAIPADAHVVALVGRLTAIKRPERFLAVAVEVARTDPRARFLVAGGGDLEADARAQASALGLADRVQWLGWRQDVAPIYAASDVTALTSRNEGTPVAIIESMAAAVPAVALAVGGVPDVMPTPDLGVLIADDANGVAAMADAIRALLNDGGRREAMGARARAHVVSRYGVDRLVRDIDRLYRSLL